MVGRVKVEKSVASCLACSLTKQNPARRQAKMRNWHPRARFHTVATDVREISPTSFSGCSKVAVIGDLVTRFMVAVPLRDEKAETIAKVLFDRWIAIFGPPLRLLSDQGKPFVSAMVKYLRAKVGTEKTETAPYHPQSDGYVEWFNRTLCNDLAKYVLDEADWDTHVTFAAFRYNSSVNSATGVTPCRAMFGVDVFEFDAGLGLQLRLDEEPDDLPSWLVAVHADLLSAGKRSRSAAEKFYNRAVVEYSYAIGDGVLAFHPPGLVETGQKLRVPWIGPYRIVERQSDVSYVLRSEIEGKSALVHVNRLRKIAEDEDFAETGDPLAGMWPDSRRILRASEQAQQYRSFKAPLTAYSAGQA
jgi:hypothetical protein